MIGKNGLIIEGVDGVGKTTQAKLLVVTLHAEGKCVEYLKSPTGSKRGENIWRVIQQLCQLTSREEEAALFLLRDMCFFQDIVTAMEEQQEIITVLDRWVGSFLNYFHTLKGMALSDLISAFELWVEPVTSRRVVLLDAPTEQTLLRLKQKVVKSRFDLVTADVLERQRYGYLKLAYLYGWTVVNATGSIPEVYASVRSHVSF